MPDFRPSLTERDRSLLEGIRNRLPLYRERIAERISNGEPACPTLNEADDIATLLALVDWLDTSISA